MLVSSGCQAANDTSTGAPRQRRAEAPRSDLVAQGDAHRARLRPAPDLERDDLARLVVAQARLAPGLPGSNASRE